MDTSCHFLITYMMATADVSDLMLTDTITIAFLRWVSKGVQQHRKKIILPFVDVVHNKIVTFRKLLCLFFFFFFFPEEIFTGFNFLNWERNCMLKTQYWPRLWKSRQQCFRQILGMVMLKLSTVQERAI